jgi:diguanylate cyclase (GGDEF)-like protein
MKKITCVLGSACLEVVSTATGQYTNNRFTGFTNVSFGGEGYYVATLLNALDTSACLINAINHNPVSQLMADDLARNKVRSHFLIDDGLPDSVANYHYTDGQLASVVLTNPNTMAVFSEDFIARALKKSYSFFLDLNPSIMTFENIVSAIDGKPEVKLFVSACDVIDIDKLNMLTHRADLIFLSEDTLKAGKLHYDCESLRELTNTVKTDLVVILDDGNILVSNYKEQKITNLKESLNIGFRHKVLRDKNFFKAAIIDIINNDPEIEILKAVESVVFNYEELAWRIDVQIEKQNPLESSMRTVIRKAHRDNLTGVLNRHGLDQFLTTPGVDLSTYTMLMIDIDKFKSVNDTYGHQVGDEVLVGIANILSDHMRQGDIAARLGGEEFVCLIKNLTPELTETVANRIRTEIEKTPLSTEQLDITVSIGCTQWQKNEMFIDVMERADQMLYKAKTSGRNKVIVS